MMTNLFLMPETQRPMFRIHCIDIVEHLLVQQQQHAEKVGRQDIVYSCVSQEGDLCEVQILLLLSPFDEVN